MLVAKNRHMVVKVIEIEKRDQPGDDVGDIIGFEANIDDRRRRRMSLEKYEIAEVAIARDKDTILSDRVRQYHFIGRVGRNVDRAHHIMPSCRQRSGNYAPDICIADQLQAARACPIAT